MTPGIFISYSREDEKQALHLLTLLRRENYSVWIDQEAIAGASIWSDEIVQNIKRSEIFIALLSASSVSSANVAKEIALAAENGKLILPIEIGTVTLPGRLEYALAGIQRTNFHDEQAILHAVRSQVARLQGAHNEEDALENLRARIKRARLKTIAGVAGVAMIAALFFFIRKAPDPAPSGESVVVLPFATLNLDRDSTHNLDIFSDELLTHLSALKTVSTIGASISSAYKDTRWNALAIAQELKARFIIEGLVRKSHDVNFVSTRLIDTKKGGEIWEQSYSGNNSELFAVRERVVNDLFGILHSVTAEEQELQNAEQNAAAHPNDAAAVAHLANLLIANDKNRSLQLFNRAIQLDSSNLAYYLSAGIAAERAGLDGKEFGQHAARLAKKKMSVYPDSVALTGSYAIALDMAGHSDEAVHLYDSLIRLYPTDVRINYNAACCYAKQGKADAALDILEKLFTFAPGKRGEVLSDPDFDNIRSIPRYQKVMYAAH